MAIIYTYPNLPLSSLSAEDLLVITNVDAANNNPTRSVTLADIATYVTGTGGGTGTTNKIVKFTDGANGLLGDSIMTESTGLIDLAGQFVSTSSPTLTQGAPVSGIKATLNSTTSAPNIALYGESKHTGGVQTNSNYGLYAKGEFEGTGGFTTTTIGGYLEGRYDGSGTNGATATVYGSYNLARSTSVANGTIDYHIGTISVSKIEGANTTVNNLQGVHSTVELTNGTAGDVIVQILDFDTTGGGTVTGDLSYLQIQNDTMPTVAGTKRAINSKSVLPSLFTGQVEIPLVPTINAHATSKQYVDQQISSVVSGLVFQSTWDASSTPGGNPDLTDASKKVVGHYYVVSVAGSATPNGAGTLPNSWNVGDWCIYVEQGATDRWEKLDQTFVSGAGANKQVTFWNSQNEVAGDNNFLWDNTNKRLSVGIDSPATKLHVSSGVARTDTNKNYTQFISSNDVDDFLFGMAVAHKGGAASSDRYVSIDSVSYKKSTQAFSTSGDLVLQQLGGNVGIGTNTPAAKLDVDTGRIQISSSGTKQLSFGTDATIEFGSDSNIQVRRSGSGLQFKTGGSEVMRIDSAGKVGIGTSSPAENLHVKTGSNTTILIEGNQNTRFASLQLKNADQLWIPRLEGTSLDFVIRDDTASSEPFRIKPAANVGSNDGAITIDGDANVGIGTTTPESKLTIKGDPGNTNQPVRITNTTKDIKTGLFINGTGNAVNEKYGMQFGGYNEYSIGGIFGVLDNLSGSTSGDITIDFGNGTAAGDLIEKVRFTHEGNVGIGTDSPVSKLETKDGDIRVTTLNAFSNLISSRAGVPSAGGYNTGGLLFQAYSTGTTFSTGAAIYSYADGGAWTATSVPSYLSFQTVPSGLTGLKERMRIDSAGDISIFPRATAASSGSGILYFKNVDDNSATINGASIRTVDSSSNPSGADMRFQVASDSGVLSDAVTIDSNGFMGIGTTAPDQQLEVSGNIRLSNGAQRNIIGPTNENLGIFANPNDATEGILFSTDAGSTTEMIILNGGNVGIGTTSPSYKLHTKGTVNGNVNIAVENDSTGADAYSSYRFKNDSIDTAVMFLNGSNNTSYAGASSLNIYQGTDLPLGFVTSNLLRMIVTGDGKVGIGTTSPGYPLDIVGFANSNSGFRVTDGTIDNRISWSSGNVGFFGTISNHPIAFNTNSIERMRIDNGGNVLIGTTGIPNGTSVYGSGFIPVSTDKVQLRMASSSVIGGSLLTFHNPNGAVGNITITGSSTAYNTSSDYRLKKDLKDFDGLDKVSKIPVYDFKWKADDSSSYGVVAHELQEVLPDAVSGEKDGEEMQGVDYSKIVPLLIKSIQELEAKVKILENK